MASFKQTQRERKTFYSFSLSFFVSKNDLFSKSKIQVVNVQYANKFTDFRQKNKDEGDEGTKVKGLKSLISKLFIINYSLSIVPIVELLNRRTCLCLSEPETRNSELFYQFYFIKYFCCFFYRFHIGKHYRASCIFFTKLTLARMSSHVFKYLTKTLRLIIT